MKLIDLIGGEINCFNEDDLPHYNDVDEEGSDYGMISKLRITKMVLRSLAMKLIGHSLRRIQYFCRNFCSTFTARYYIYYSDNVFQGVSVLHSDCIQV